MGVAVVPFAVVSGPIDVSAVLVLLESASPVDDSVTSPVPPAADSTGGASSVEALQPVTKTPMHPALKALRHALLRQAEPNAKAMGSR